MSLQINDPVHVSRDNRQLEGVVAYLGEVDFSDGDDWVGIRLTGSSVGLGKNDGSVQGKAYFQCPNQCGLFVKKNLVQKRQLTKLEELRLKRELASTGDSGSAPASAAVTPSRSSSGMPGSAGKTPKTPVTTASTTTAARLEEIRQRRAQLAGRTPSTSTDSLTGLDPATKATSTATTTTTSMATPGANQNPKEMEELQAHLKSKQEELESLQQQLKESQATVSSKDRDIASLQEKVLAAQLETQQHSNSAAPAAPALEDQDSYQHHLEQLTNEFQNYQKESQQKLEAAKEKIQHVEVELTKAKAESKELMSQLTDLTTQQQSNEVRAASDAASYKERAKLQAEVASLNRRVEQLEYDKQELENNVEELALDKEQLQEEKESLEDRLEELKLDSETAQMEVEELKMELEQAKVAQEATVASAPATEGQGDGANEAQDMASNLSIQNARLREALIRLREQSSVKQMDLSRQLRSAEKQADEARSQLDELNNLRQLKSELEEQISDLKDMVEQGSAYEVMVEDLSDRVLSLEEELMASQQMIRELEEAADITAEMEEVQTEELKAVNRDLEDRETIIRNLEEAIRMQRKREEDFQRTVSNYRATVETLKQEKKALLELHEGGEGEKSDLVSASQKALTRAAQLVQDAAEMRKREAQAAIDRIDSQVRKHLSERLESMLPSSVASAEIASIKGELLLSKVVGKASLSLDGIARSFSKTIRARAWEWRSEKEEESEEEKIDEVIMLTDEQQQFAATMIHQSEVAHVAIDVSGDLLWLLSAGQWPDIVGPEASSELGAIMGHSMDEMDMVLGNVLNTLKEEGVLSPHQSNIGAFRQTVIRTMQTLRSHIEHDGDFLIPMDWKPPALRLFRDASRAKYASLGCYAAVASVLNHGDSNKTAEVAEKSKTMIKVLGRLLRKLDSASSEAAKSCLRLATLNVQEDNIVADITGVAGRWRAACDDLMGNIFNMMSSEEGITPNQLSVCEAAADEVLRIVSQFAAVLRTANLTVTDDQRFHPFSPEVADVWEGVTLLARSIRAQDGDDEDVNYLVRARAIERTLEQAVEKEPKLALANAKVASLEKSLALRSKEIAVQNTRLSELEKLLARTSAQPSSRIKSAELASEEELNNLKQENRVLSEAMDVLHRQVEDYENEIRFLKDTKSPTKGRAPRRSYTADTIRERTRSGEGLQGEPSDAQTGAFEAALFRPALQAARRDAAHWRTQTTVTKLLELPPLHIPSPKREGEEKAPDDGDDMSPLLQLSSALSNYQHQTVSVKVVDLSKRGTGRSPRAELYSMVMKKASAAQQLDEASASARQWLESRGSRTKPYSIDSGPILGRVKFAGQQPVQTIPTPTTMEDLYRLQMHMVR